MPGNPGYSAHSQSVQAAFPTCCRAQSGRTSVTANARCLHGITVHSNFKNKRYWPKQKHAESRLLFHPGMSFSDEATKQIHAVSCGTLSEYGSFRYLFQSHGYASYTIIRPYHGHLQENDAGRRCPRLPRAPSVPHSVVQRFSLSADCHQPTHSAVCSSTPSRSKSAIR